MRGGHSRRAPAGCEQPRDREFRSLHGFTDKQQPLVEDCALTILPRLIHFASGPPADDAINLIVARARPKEVMLALSEALSVVEEENAQNQGTSDDDDDEDEDGYSIDDDGAYNCVDDQIEQLVIILRSYNTRKPTISAPYVHSRQSSLV